MGGTKKTPTEGGSGGKRGHSNMEHWTHTADIKDAARVQRRVQDKKEAELSLEAARPIRKKKARPPSKKP